MLAWDEPDWLDEATAWIDTRIERISDVELVKTTPWSAVARVPTEDGDVWFKENPPYTAFEPALTALLSRRRDDVPEVIAREGPRMITRSAGTRLRALFDEGTTELRWEELLAQYAELQLDVTETVDEALAIGTPDAHVKRLSTAAATLTDDAELIDIAVAAGELLANTLPATVVHMEAHDGNIFVDGDRAVFIDWAEAVVTHPFLGPLLPLRFAAERLEYAPGSRDVDRLRDAYLEPFTSLARAEELRAWFSDAYLLAPVCRALSWHELLQPLGTAAAEEHEDPVGAWLRILRSLAAGEILLGGA